MEMKIRIFEKMSKQVNKNGFDFVNQENFGVPHTGTILIMDEMELKFSIAYQFFPLQATFTFFEKNVIPILAGTNSFKHFSYIKYYQPKDLEEFFTFLETQLHKAKEESKQKNASQGSSVLHIKHA